MIWIPIIAEHKIHLEECEERLSSNYNYLPSEEDTPIVFSTYEEAKEWAIENIKSEYLVLSESDLTVEELRNKYLKV